MDFLKRSLAPISSEGWEFIDSEAREVLRIKLTGRKSVDFIGPKGFEYGAINTGRISKLNEASEDGIEYSQRQIIPLLEIKVPFKMPLKEFEALARGANDVDSQPIIEAAQKLAGVENRIIFHGYPAANFQGIVDKAEESIELTKQGQLLVSLQQGIKKLADAGIGGPYILAVNPELYTQIWQESAQSYPTYQKIKDLLAGDIILVDDLAVKGLIMSRRGGDFELTIGQDISIGFEKYQGEEIEFYFLESLAFRVITPEAAIVLN